MKKIYLILALTAGILASCDMDKEQFCENGTTFTYNSIDRYHDNEPAMGGYSNNIVVSEKFAIKIQEKANEMYPGLFKPIILRNSRYNQQLAIGSSIIEVGATGNTMEQCLVSMRYLSKILSEVLATK